MAIASINPATGEKLKEFSSFDDAEIEKRLSRAEKAFRKYRRTTFTDRSVLLEAVAELLFQDKEKFAQIITLETEQVEKVIIDPRVKAVTLTGSEKAGSAVASTAAREIKKSVLELGGSDAFIVMPSADFERALRTSVKARTINTGQSCIAAKRFMIADQIYDEFLDQFVAHMRALKVGDPMDPEIDIGPLATEQILQGLHDQVQKSIAVGAKLLTGGNRIHGPGFFYEPTVLVDSLKNRAQINDSPTPGNTAIKGAPVSGMKNLRIRFRARVRDHIDRGSVALVRQVFAIQKN